MFSAISSCNYWSMFLFILSRIFFSFNWDLSSDGPRGGFTERQSNTDSRFLPARFFTWGHPLVYAHFCANGRIAQNYVLVSFLLVWGNFNFVQLNLPTESRYSSFLIFPCIIIIDFYSPSFFFMQTSPSKNDHESSFVKKKFPFHFVAWVLIRYSSSSFYIVYKYVYF